MSQGLSHLQRQILCLALEQGFLSTETILCSWWGWEPAEWGAKKASVGEREYNAAHASLSRSISRLWGKNLVIIWKNLTNSATRITLTPEGETIAQAIMAEDQKKQFNG